MPPQVFHPGLHNGALDLQHPQEVRMWEGLLVLGGGGDNLEKVLWQTRKLTCKSKNAVMCDRKASRGPLHTV